VGVVPRRASPPERFLTLALELVALKPDAILAVQFRRTHLLPCRQQDDSIVIMNVSDPVGAGLERPRDASSQAPLRLRHEMELSNWHLDPAVPTHACNTKSEHLALHMARRSLI